MSIDVSAHQGHRLALARRSASYPRVDAFCEDCQEWLPDSAPATPPGGFGTRQGT